MKNDSEVNPLLWQIGHVIYFFDNLVLKNLNNCERLNVKYFDYNYDSFITPLKYRDHKRLNYNQLLFYFNYTIKLLKSYVNDNSISNIESYLIMLGCLHTDMHIEAFIFSKLKISNIIQLNITIKHTKIIKDIEFIKYSSGDFNQGSNHDSEYLNFDNEMPSFKNYVKSFSISKYPITEYLYLQFIINEGYKKKQYWCDISYKWKNDNNIELPLYWQYSNGKYYKVINNQKLSVETNLPICHISYYEANAYCKWKKCRLPKEVEYEYVSTNKGTTKFPWGDNLPNNRLCNINYKNNLVNVNNFNLGENNNKVSQLIGNIWEWCEEPIYPYNGFIIDPVYREMSYPFFGYKKICKGGCFAVPDYLIHPKYRNAQYPDCRIQFIGFRVCF